MPAGDGSPQNEDDDEDEDDAATKPDPKLREGSTEGPGDEDELEDDDGDTEGRCGSSASATPRGSEEGSYHSGDGDGEIPPSNASGSFVDDSSRPETPEQEGANTGDRLIAWWCQKELGRCLKRLQRHDQAGPFLEPVPWEELGLDDYLEVVQDPMDLETIEEFLEGDEYEDEQGLVNPEWFWEDVGLCWENCIVYYEGEEEVDAYKMALDMKAFAQELEDEFWDGMDTFEENLGKVDPALHSIAAAADAAADAVEDAATKGGVLVQDLSAALYRMFGGWGGDAGPAQPAPKKKGPKLGPLSTRQDLLDFYSELFETYFESCDLDVAFGDMEDLQADLTDAFGFELPEIRKALQMELQQEEADVESASHLFEGASEKRPIAELLPSDFKCPGGSVSIGKGTSPCTSSRGGSFAGALTPRAGGYMSSRSNSRMGSRTSSRRGSRNGNGRASRRSGHSANSAPTASDGGSSIGRRISSRSGRSNNSGQGSQAESETDGEVKAFSRQQMAKAMPKRTRRGSVGTVGTAHTASTIQTAQTT